VGQYTESSSRYRDQTCPECRERIPGDALVCPVCDTPLVDAHEVVDRLPEVRRRRPRYTPHNGQTIMILGIVSFVVMPHILGPVAWIMGYMDLKKIRRGEMDPEGESPTRTGMICGMISTILHALIIIVVFGIIGVACIGGLAFSSTKTNTTPTPRPTPASSRGF
jgi:hypothetical protein